MNLKYGDYEVVLNLPDNQVPLVLSPVQKEALANPEEELLKALRQPIASAPLNEIVKRGETVCILANDSTRLARTEFFMPFIIDELIAAGIKESDIFIIFANGSHRAMNEQEMVAQVGRNCAARVRLYNHDSRDDANLVHFGVTKRGTPVLANKMAVQADRLILTGSVVHHFFAGYGGGRKALIPGVAGWETIRKNHSLLLEDGACTGQLAGNPVHEDLLEAAQMVGSDFLLNTVLNEQKAILGFFAGDMVDAHLAACTLVDQVNSVEIEQPAELVITSCGGYPKDINLYQAHKTLDNAIRALARGGRMVMLAECREGIGSAIFEEWIHKYESFAEMEGALRDNFVLGGHKAYTVSKLLKQGTVYLVSDLPVAVVEKLGFRAVSSLDEAMGLVLNDNPVPQTIVIPQGSIVLPRIK